LGTFSPRNHSNIIYNRLNENKNPFFINNSE
jgi:hypothetical protein